MPKSKLWSRISGWRNQLQVIRVARQVASHIPKTSTAQPVVFFNASTRITGLSQNAAFTLLTSWALRLSGVPVHHFVCQSGMSHCVLGTNRENYHKAPPCQACIAPIAPPVHRRGGLLVLLSSGYRPGRRPEGLERGGAEQL